MIPNHLGMGLIAPSRLLIASILTFMLILGIACGEESTPTPAPTSTPTSPPAPTATPTPQPQVLPSPTATSIPASTPTMAPPPTSTATPVPTPTATPVPIPTATPTPTPTPFLFVVTDSSGKEVTFEEPPKRIISYDSPAVEILYAIGEGWRIAGTHDFVSYPPEAEDIPKVGGAFNINVEKLVELEPDLIYTFYGSSVPDLENAGTKVLYLETPQNIAGIADQIRMWGNITDNVAGAEQVALEFEARVEALLDQLASVAEGPRIFHDDSLFYTRGPETLLGKVYTLLKAQNIAHDLPGGLYGQLSPEVIVERDPEVIITTFSDRPKDFTGDPAFQNVSAVREGRVYSVDGNLVSVAGPRFVEAIEQLARLLHPDLFPEG